MNTSQIWIATAATAGLIGLAGCSSKDEAGTSTRADPVGAEVSAQPDTAGEKLDQAQASVGQSLDDTAITARVKALFAESAAVSALDISVETEQGVVSLTGTVSTEVERAAAENLARSVADVHDVKNGIVIKS